MSPTEINWLLGAISTVGLTITAAVGVLWRRAEKLADQTIAALTKQAADAGEAKGVAEKHAGALEMKVAFLKQQVQTLVRALDKARVQVDPSAMVGGVSMPPTYDDPSAVWYIEAEKQSEYFLGPRNAREREEVERRRQRPLNPEAERREAENKRWIEEQSRRYVEGSEPPTRR